MDNFKRTIAGILDISPDSSDEQLIDRLKGLKEENIMLNLAIDNSADSFNISDSKGVFLKANNAFIERSSISSKDITGISTNELVSEGLYGPSSIMLAIKEKKRVCVMQNGQGGNALAISTPIFDENGNIKYVVSNARFVNELVELKEFLENNNNNDSVSFENADKKMICKSSAMKSVVDIANVVAPTNSSILITGETGTGKSLLARYIHDKSLRKNGEFVEINCAAIPDSLMESELFGYEAGAFTGANANGKKGLMELADGGTLFLDEIGDMPLNLQAKLLQALQNRQVKRVGGEKSIDIDIRLITATNKNLENMIANEEFREELYYRINVVPIYIPALRERRDDIPVIIESTLHNSNNDHGKNTVISNEAMDMLISYSWPGNIRELENIIERLVVIDRKGVITETDLPARFMDGRPVKSQGVIINEIIPLNSAVESVEKQLISIAYLKYKNSYKVADALGISQSSASRKIIKYVKEAKEKKE